MARHVLAAFMAFISLLAATAAWAYDCPEPGEEPYTPELVEDERAFMQYACCCLDNEFDVAEHVLCLQSENHCCDSPDNNCNTWWISIRREATPVVRSGLWNEVVNDELVWSTVPEWTIDRMCVCEGGYGAICGPTIYAGALWYDFSCVDCED